jgi:hypothetical protein
MKSPRTLQNVQERIAELRSFAGTKYDFDSVSHDKEAVDLLVAVENILRLAGWDRKPLLGRFPALAIFGQTDAVSITIDAGIKIVVEDKASQNVLDAALALKGGLSSSLVPKGRVEDVLVRRSPGDAQVIHLIIGKKP